MRLTVQVVVSCIIVLGVLWFMWRLPRRGESLFGWAPPMALLSVWAGLMAVVISLLLWFVPVPDVWLVALLLILDPGSIAAGTLVLWIYRGYEQTAETIRMQRTQAVIGIMFGLAAVAIGYLYVMLHKPIGSAVGV